MVLVLRSSTLSSLLRQPLQLRRQLGGRGPGRLHSAGCTYRGRGRLLDDRCGRRRARTRRGGRTTYVKQLCRAPGLRYLDPRAEVVTPPVGDLPRHLKSSNILHAGQRPEPKLSDFGISRATTPRPRCVHAHHGRAPTDGYCAPDYAVTGNLASSPLTSTLRRSSTGRRAGL